MSQPILQSIQVGQPSDYGTPGATDPMDRPWRTGFIKKPVLGPVFLGRINLEGDGQADRVHHGGPDKAVLCYGDSHYEGWRLELDLPEMGGGDFGENFTIQGLSESNVCIGDIWEVGEAKVQVTQPRQPCWKLARRWRIKDLALRVQRSGRTGWYLRVLNEGFVATGQPLVLLDRSFPDWTIARANHLMHHDRHNRELAAALAEVDPLSASWKRTLSRRALDGTQPETSKRLEGENRP